MGDFILDKIRTLSYNFHFIQIENVADEYGLNEDDYYIVKYTGKAENLTLPTQTETGKPITAIGRFAFSGCETLRNVTVPNEIIAIFSGGFYDCKNLKTVQLGSGVSHISEWYVFTKCGSMSNISVDENNPYYYMDNHCLIDRRSNTLMYGYANSVIPEGIECISDCAFSENYTPATIQIPQSVKKIGSYAFSANKGMSKIYLHKNIESIGDCAFLNCPNLTIYCESEQKPLGWSDIWIDRVGGRYTPATVVWGYQEAS